MSTTHPTGHHPTGHDRTDLTRLLPLRPARCFRHRVWMAACDDCRTAHRERIGTAGPGRRDDGSTSAGE